MHFGQYHFIVYLTNGGTFIVDFEYGLFFLVCLFVVGDSKVIFKGAKRDL